MFGSDSEKFFFIIFQKQKYSLKIFKSMMKIFFLLLYISYFFLVLAKYLEIALK